MVVSDDFGFASKDFILPPQYKVGGAELSSLYLALLAQLSSLPAPNFCPRTTLTACFFRTA